MTEITLSQILDAREKRVEKQKLILNRFNLPVICFTMNIAGPVKTSPLIERSFFEGIKLLKNNLPKKVIVYEEIVTEPTGCQGLFSVSYNAEEIKKISVAIEDSCPLGRLFDIDVINTDGVKLEREKPRNCLICGASGRVCAASRAHSVEELQNVTKNIMENYFFQSDKHIISELAVKSLIDEVYTTPKPGLVDCRNNGSHTDMNINTFIKSAYTLKNYFEECFIIGRNSKSTDKIFPELRSAGIIAENNMYNATDGINTHKGVIYSMGILCAAVGKLWSPERPFKNPSEICRESAGLVAEYVSKDFEQIDKSTAGGRLYLSHGLTGIRGEVASGFKSVLNISLPCYKKLSEKNLTPNDAGSVTLLHLIANIEDTNLYHRGGVSGAQYAKKITQELLSKNPEPTKEEIEILDDAFIERNLSPGGCADLLAITYFLYALHSLKIKP